MLEYLTAYGDVQFVHIKVKLPAVLVEFCVGWRISDGFAVIGQSTGSSKQY